MTDQKLVDDVVTAFADRDITAPSRDDIARVLEVFETSLRRCGCDACTTARRERIGLTEHDLTALARVLHEVVYSPGASFDRAVPGIQEYMHACAEKVAAALPWMVPTPEVELVAGQTKYAVVDVGCTECGAGMSDPIIKTVTTDFTAASEEAKSLSNAGKYQADAFVIRLDDGKIVAHLGGALGLEWITEDDRPLESETATPPEVPEPSLIEIAHRIGATERSRHDFDVATSRPLGSEPQGEPSDAQVEAVAQALYESTWANGDYEKTSDFNKDSWRRHARAALRAAGGAR